LGSLLFPSHDRGEGFFNIGYKRYSNCSSCIIDDVMNYYKDGSTKSANKSFNESEKKEIPKEGGSLWNTISFDYVTRVMAGKSLSLKFNASSNSGNVSSETYSFKPPSSEEDVFYRGRFTLLNLPQNSTIVITANGDSENELVVKTSEPKFNCDKEWSIIEKQLYSDIKNKGEIKTHLCKKELYGTGGVREFMENQISFDYKNDGRFKFDCLVNRYYKVWCKGIDNNYN